MRGQGSLSSGCTPGARQMEGGVASIVDLGRRRPLPRFVPSVPARGRAASRGGRDVMCGRVYTRRRRARDVRRAAERAERMHLEGAGDRG
jgi:hypothetical protein